MAHDPDARLRVLLVGEDGREETIYEADLADLLPELATGDAVLFDETGATVAQPVRVIAFALAERLEDALRPADNPGVRVALRLGDVTIREFSPLRV